MPSRAGPKIYLGHSFFDTPETFVLCQYVSRTADDDDDDDVVDGYGCGGSSCRARQPSAIDGHGRSSHDDTPRSRGAPPLPRSTGNFKQGYSGGLLYDCSYR